MRHEALQKFKKWLARQKNLLPGQNELEYYLMWCIMNTPEIEKKESLDNYPKTCKTRMSVG